MSDSPAVSTPPSFSHPGATDDTLFPRSSPQRSITSSPVKKRAPKGNSRCICGDKRCDETIVQLKLLNQTDHILHGYFRLPFEPKKSTLQLSKKRQQDRLANARRRERFLQALPKDARLRSEDPSYSAKSNMIIAAIHFHPKILHLCEIDKGGKRKLTHSIPRSLGLELTRETKCVFTKADEVTPGGDYFPIPNFTVRDARDVVNELESNVVYEAKPKKVTVPPGKLGLTVNAAKFGDGQAGLVIRAIAQTCTFNNKVKVGDRILTCDGKTITKVEDLRGGNDRARQLGIVQAKTQFIPAVKRKASEVEVGTSSRGSRTKAADSDKNDDNDGDRLAQPSYARVIEQCSSMQQLELHETYLKNELQQVRNRMEYLKSRCNVDGCDNKAQEGGACEKHGGKKWKKIRKKCTVEGCSTFSMSGGGCCMRHTVDKPRHYYCIVDGCTKKRQHARGGMCARHFTQSKEKEEEASDEEYDEH